MYLLPVLWILFCMYYELWNVIALLFPSGPISINLHVLQNDLEKCPLLNAEMDSLVLLKITNAEQMDIGSQSNFHYDAIVFFFFDSLFLFWLTFFSC